MSVCPLIAWRAAGRWLSGVTGHFPDGPAPRPWVSIDECVTGHCATIVGAPRAPPLSRAAGCAISGRCWVGALPEEVAVMNTLTVNLHLLMVRVETCRHCLRGHHSSAACLRACACGPGAILPSHCFSPQDSGGSKGLSFGSFCSGFPDSSGGVRTRVLPRQPTLYWLPCVAGILGAGWQL